MFYRIVRDNGGKLERTNLSLAHRKVLITSLCICPCSDLVPDLQDIMDTRWWPSPGARCRAALHDCHGLPQMHSHDQTARSCNIHAQFDLDLWIFRHDIDILNVFQIKAETSKEVLAYKSPIDADCGHSDRAHPNCYIFSQSACLSFAGQLSTYALGQAFADQCCALWASGMSAVQRCRRCKDINGMLSLDHAC